MYIEVKSKQQVSEIKDVILTRNEWRVAQLEDKRENYFIYLVTDVLKKPKTEKLRNPYKAMTDGKISPVEVNSYQLFLYPDRGEN